LTLTSNPTRTSPVKRGKWILEQILGTPPPPPPPAVPELSEKAEAVQAASLRQRLEQHRADPNCSSCHNIMDPIGFAFENFDGIGAWREKDGSFAIDPAGVLAEGQAIRGVDELKKVLLERKEEFYRSLATKVLTYGLGRGVEYRDRPALEEITRATSEGGGRFSAMILAIVKSDPFGRRRGERG
jgi:hypothetical protein